MANNNNDVPTSGPQPKFGNQEFTEEELDIMRRKLEEKIEAKHISYRKGHDGGLFISFFHCLFHINFY